MKLKKYITAFVAAGLTLSFSSCNDFLSTTPDSRADAANFGQDEIRSILISAYPEASYALLGELSSDNVVNNLDASMYATPFYTQVYNWEDITEADNEGPTRLWEVSYEVIQHANLALQTIA